MTRGPKAARVRILISFNGMRVGDEVDIVLNQKVRGWIAAGLAKVVGSGKNPARPGGAEPVDQGGVPDGTGDGSPSGDEPGQGFGSSGYGTAQGVGQD